MESLIQLFTYMILLQLIVVLLFSPPNYPPAPEKKKPPPNLYQNPSDHTPTFRPDVEL